MKITLKEINGDQPAEYPVTVAGGAADSESSKYCEGELVTVSADKAEEGMQFEKWVAEGVTLEDETANPVSFRMPAGEVKLTAQYKEIVKHTVKVENGKLVNGKTEDKVAVGSPVTVSAPANNEAGEVFDHWEITGVEVEKNDSRQLNFVMPDGDVTLSAVYKSAASSGDNTGSDGTDTGKAPTTGDSKPADGSVNVVLVVVLTAAISIILTALVMYLIFDKKTVSPARDLHKQNAPDFFRVRFVHIGSDRQSHIMLRFPTPKISGSDILIPHTIPGSESFPNSGAVDERSVRRNSMRFPANFPGTS